MALHEPMPYDHRSVYRTRCSCGWVSEWFSLVAAQAALDNHLEECS